jgi:hypothetical protein
MKIGQAGFYYSKKGATPQHAIVASIAADGKSAHMAVLNAGGTWESRREVPLAATADDPNGHYCLEGAEAEEKPAKPPVK